jgi:hypothetical protein
MQTGTNLIIVKEGKLTRISAQALRESAVTRDPQVSAGL